MTSRLTNYQRDAIVRHAVADVIDPEQARLRSAENTLLSYVLIEIAEAHGLLAKYAGAKTLPSEWIATSASIHVEAAGARVELHPHATDGKPQTLLPTVLVLRGGSHKFDRGNPLTKQILSLDDDRKALRKRKDTIEARVRALVNQVSTLAKLMELWPEGEPYWAFLRDKKPSRNLPTVKVDEINKLLGLPKDAKNAA